MLVAVLVGGLLSGCSGSTDSYCSSVRDDRAQLRQLAGDAGSGSGSLSRSVEVLSGLRDEAPDDISAEWTTLVDALQDLVDAVEESGADISDFSSGKKPEGVSSGQLQAVRQAAAELQSTRVQQAGKSIEQHARDVCKVDLGGGLGDGAGGGAGSGSGGG